MRVQVRSKLQACTYPFIISAQRLAAAVLPLLQKLSYRFPSCMADTMASATGTTSQDEDMLATYAGAKRRIAALEQQLQDMQRAGSKRKL